MRSLDKHLLQVHDITKLNDKNDVEDGVLSVSRHPLVSMVGVPRDL